MSPQETGSNQQDRRASQGRRDSQKKQVRYHSHVHSQQCKKNGGAGGCQCQNGAGGRRRVEEGVMAVNGMPAVVMRNATKCKLAFIAFHGWNEGPDSMRPFAEEFYRQYPDCQACWVLPQAPYDAKDGFSWWPGRIGPELAASKMGIKQMCRIEPPEIDTIRRSISSLIQETERHAEVPSGMVVLLGTGQGAVMALDCLFNLPRQPRTIGLWNPEPALFDAWKSSLATAKPQARDAMLSVPIFVQDNTVTKFDTMMCELVDCFLTFEAFKMTSLNDDHLGPGVTPTCAGNFFRFVNPPRGWEGSQRPSFTRSASLFEETKQPKTKKYFCGWPFCGAGN